MTNIHFLNLMQISIHPIQLRDLPVRPVLQMELFLFPSIYLFLLMVRLCHSRQVLVVQVLVELTTKQGIASQRRQSNSALMIKHWQLPLICLIWICTYHFGYFNWISCLLRRVRPKWPSVDVVMSYCPKHHQLLRSVFYFKV